MLFTETEFQSAQRVVYDAMVSTSQIAWPLLAERLGGEVWVKHENHTPTGAFKVRGGLVHMRLRHERGETGGVISATTGNHGQSIAIAGAREGIPVVIVAPQNNCAEKNASMRARGAELILTGRDFDEAASAAHAIAEERNLQMVPSFHAELCMGVSTYGRELFNAVEAIDTIYVPIGLGSGICGIITQRDLLGLKTEIVGVVSDKANAYALSYETGSVTATNSVATFAEGMAVRVPNRAALDIIRKGAARIVEVSDDEVAEAVRIYYSDTHNLAEGAGAGALAARIKEGEGMIGKRTAVILTGGNINKQRFADILAGNTPSP